jgi:hypothetical protein
MKHVVWCATVRNPRRHSREGGDPVNAVRTVITGSFTSPFDANSKRVIGIRGLKFAPMNLPNVVRNVIAHKLGHAIDLGHNSDPAMLMCGRPAPCRPVLFRSNQPRLFPLTDTQRQQLIAMYPKG